MRKKNRKPNTAIPWFLSVLYNIRSYQSVSLRPMHSSGVSKTYFKKYPISFLKWYFPENLKFVMTNRKKQALY